jgi:hypothetical protein
VALLLLLLLLRPPTLADIGTRLMQTMPPSILCLAL